MDRNRDNLITYEEFRYYVGIIQGDMSQLNVNNMSKSLNSNEETKLEVWRDQWRKTARRGEDTISKEDAIDNIKEQVREPMSPGLIRSLQTQMDINGDGMIDFHEYARACEKVLSE